MVAAVRSIVLALSTLAALLPGCAPDQHLRGLVVDERGDPVARFLLEVRRADDPSWELRAPCRTERRSLAHPFDGEGAFALDELAAGDCMVTALGDGDLESETYRVTLPGGARPLELVLARPAQLSGTVVDGAGAPLPFASVFVADRAELERAVARGDPLEPLGSTDGAGRFRFDHVRPRSVLLSANERCADATSWLALDLAPASTHDVTLRVASRTRVIGQIDPSLGDPAGRRVDLLGFVGTRGWRSTRSDPNGRFAVEDAWPQRSLIHLHVPGAPRYRGFDGSMEIEPSEWPVVRREFELADGTTREVRFERHARDVVARERVTIGGVPTAGLEVTAEGLEEQDDLGQRAMTDAAGRFELPLAASGRWRFRVEKSWSSVRHFERRVEDRGEHAAATALADFELPGGAVSGLLTDPWGTPLAHVPVTLRRAGAGDAPDVDESAIACAWTDDSGRFEIVFLEPSRYELRAPDGLRFQQPRPVVPWGRVVRPALDVSDRPHAPLVVALRAETRLAVRVVDDAGAPVVGAHLLAFDADGVAMAAESDGTSGPDGRCQIVALPPGRYTVLARDATREGQSAPRFASAGKVVEVVVLLR